MATCEMCGKDAPLVTATVEGGEFQVCGGCAKYGTVKKNHVKSRSSFRSKREQVNYKVVSNYATLLRKERERRGMSQEEFSNLLQEKNSVVSKWESGSLKPKVSDARQLGRILKINFLEKESEGEVEVKTSKKTASELTLGDFIKVRKREK